MQFPHDSETTFWRSAGLYLALLAYVAFIVYGSLYPLTHWRMPAHNPLSFLSDPWPRYVTRTDITTNVLVYIPFGLLLGAILYQTMKLRQALIWVTVCGLVFSFVMEYLQMFVPGRNSSYVDIMTNTLGTFIGVLSVRFVEYHTWPSRPLLAWRKRLFLPGLWVDTGLVLLGMWAVSQMSLQVPSLLAGNLHVGFRPFWESMNDLHLVRLEQAAIYMLEITALGLFVATMVRPHHRMVPVVFTLFIAVVLLKFLAAAMLLKMAVLGRLLSIEALLGLIAGLALLLALLHGRRRPFGVAILVLACFVGAKMLYWLANPDTAFLVTEWPVLKNSMLNVTGLAYIFSDIWPFLVMVHMATGAWIAWRTGPRGLFE